MFPEVAQRDVEVFGIELNPHQKQAGLFVGMFVGMKDIAAVPVYEVGDSGDLAFGIRAGDEQYGGGFHWVVANFVATAKNPGARIWRSSVLNGPNCPIHTSMTTLSHCATLRGFSPKFVIFAISLSINDASPS